MDHPSQTDPPAPNQLFATTHWSVVITAGAHETTRAQDAMARLCETYWFPLYSYVRRRGYSAHDAQDLTQDFFARLLEKSLVARADPERGRFRSFLLANLKNFLANEWDRSQARKRGGGQVILSFDCDAAEASYQPEVASGLTPETIFDQRCAMTLLDRAVDRLEKENVAAGRGQQFTLLKSFLTSPPDENSYAAIAAQLQMPSGSVAVAVHRLRSRFRELLRAEVAETVANPKDVADELRHLCAALQ